MRRLILILVLSLAVLAGGCTTGGGSPLLFRTLELSVASTELVLSRYCAFDPSSEVCSVWTEDVQIAREALGLLRELFDLWQSGEIEESEYRERTKAARKDFDGALDRLRDLERDIEKKADRSVE